MLSVHRFTKLWNKTDKATIGVLPVEQFFGILKDTPWPVGFARPIKSEHEDNIHNLKTLPKFQHTRERFQEMKKLGLNYCKCRVK